MVSPEVTGYQDRILLNEGIVCSKDRAIQGSSHLMIVLFEDRAVWGSRRLRIASFEDCAVGGIVQVQCNAD